LSTLTFPNTHVAGTTAKATEVNENNQAVATLINTTKLTDGNIQAAAGIAQSKIDNTVADAEIVANEIRKQTVFGTPTTGTLKAIAHGSTTPAPGTGDAVDHLVGLDTNGLFPSAASLFSAQDGGDSNLSISTAYKISSGVITAGTAGGEIDTGLTTIIGFTVTLIQPASLTLFKVTSVAGGLINMTYSGSALNTISWIAIGT